MVKNQDFQLRLHLPELTTEQLGDFAYEIIRSLYPICRSASGEGVRQTLKRIDREIGLDISNIPSGTSVFDWTVPDEWNIRDAYVANMDGERVIDFQESNLHILSYSEPVDKVVSFEELDRHLYSVKEHPDWIPYRTSYYERKWGFCVSENKRRQLKDDQYRVYIDSDLGPGNLTYGEKYIQGESEEEFLIFTHVCHPSLCNDNLSGIAVATLLAKELSTKVLNRSYRFVFAPVTIGSISWLSQNMHKFRNIKAGLVLAVVGDDGLMTYKKSRVDDCYTDKIVFNVLNNKDAEFNTIEFSPWGYDERQFSSPGINLPMGSLMRTPNGCYPEYHTSADDLNLVKPEFLADSIETNLEVLNIFDNNCRFENIFPYGEPQLGKRGLYRSTGGQQGIETNTYANLWVLNQSDGNHDLLDISKRSNLAFRVIQQAAMDLFEAGLLNKL